MPSPPITILACPVCEHPLTIGAATATCARRHSFDIARQGYLNLLPPDKRHSAEPGDSPEMLRHRRTFLHAGYYDAVARAIAETVSGALSGRADPHVADLGCGEGFFLTQLTAHAAPQTQATYIGVDISRAGVKMAAASAREITWVVASLHRSPFLPASIDLALSMFAPIDVADLTRIVTPDGFVVTVTPGPDHLDALRAVIYPSVTPHPGVPAPIASDSSFFAVNSTRVRYQIAVESPAQIMNLLAMTPYYWNISLDTRARVETLARLDLTVDASINVFRRRPSPATF